MKLRCARRLLASVSAMRLNDEATAESLLALRGCSAHRGRRWEPRGRISEPPERPRQ